MKTIVIIIIIIIHFTSCNPIEFIAGAGYDIQRFQKERELKIKEIQLESAEKLYEKITNQNDLKADLNVSLNSSMINKLFDQYENSVGNLDEDNYYKINTIDVSLLNGSAIATLELVIKNEFHDITVLLLMDCLINIVNEDKQIGIRLEPFNISPKVSAKGIYKAAKSTIDKLIRLNLSELSEEIPIIPIPIEIESDFEIAQIKQSYKSDINFSVYSPKRTLNYGFKLEDIIFYEDKIQILVNLIKVAIK